MDIPTKTTTTSTSSHSNHPSSGRGSNRGGGGGRLQGRGATGSNPPRGRATYTPGSGRGGGGGRGTSTNRGSNNNNNNNTTTAGRGGWSSKPATLNTNTTKTTSSTSGAPPQPSFRYEAPKTSETKSETTSVSTPSSSQEFVIHDGNTSPFSHLVVHSKKQPYDVYIGRPGPWGNPFRIDHDGDRNEVIRRYRIWLTTTPEGQRILEKAKVELVGKVLACWCAPEACHGHVLAELVNTNQPQGTYTLLKDGVVLIKNAFTIAQQQEMVDEICKYARGEFPECGSFYGTEITKEDGYVDPVPEDSDPTCGRLNLGTKARMNIPFDKAPKSIWIYCKEVLDRARALCPSIPDMNPTVWRVNYYKTRGKIGWHFDRHPRVSMEEQHTVKSPVVSVTIGNAGSFDFKDNASVEEHDTVKLESGDVIIFGGPARLLYHRMIKVWPQTTPKGLDLKEFGGRINYAFYDN